MAAFNTSVRDALQASMDTKDDAKWLSVKDVAAEHPEVPGTSFSGCMTTLFQRSILARRTRDGSGTGTGIPPILEYTKGEKYHVLAESAGRKLPEMHWHGSSRNSHGEIKKPKPKKPAKPADTPAAKEKAATGTSGVGITLPIRGKREEFTMEQARDIWVILNLVFGTK